MLYLYQGPGVRPQASGLSLPVHHLASISWPAFRELAPLHRLLAIVPLGAIAAVRAFAGREAVLLLMLTIVISD